MQGGREPGPDHPITIGPSGEHVIVRAGHSIVAETSNALVLREANYPPVIYIPREDVMMDLLEPTSTSTRCPYKGDASYYGVRGGRGDVAWSYENPFESMAAIRGHIAFYPHRIDGIQTAPKD